MPNDTHAGHITYGGTLYTNPGDGTILVNTPPLSHPAKTVTAKITASTGAVVIVDVRDGKGAVTRTSTLYIGPGETTAITAAGLVADLHDRVRARLVGGIQGTIRLSLTPQ